MPTEYSQPPTMHTKDAQGPTRSSSHRKSKHSRAPSPHPHSTDTAYPSEADHEVLYSSPGAAKRAFRIERESNPSYRRCPTPHVSQSGRIRSHASLATARESASALTVTPCTAGLDHYDPSDNVEIITGPLGRKEPKHRTMLPGMLRPALRSTTRLPQQISPPRPDKPLPSRPMSILTSRVDTLFRIASRSTVSSAPRRNTLFRTQSRSSTLPSSQPVAERANPITNLFSSLSIGTPSPHSRYQRPRDHLVPAENLNDYLRLATVPGWDRWPESAGDGGWFGGSKSAGWKGTSVGWEWMRRLEDAERERPRGRALQNWQGSDRQWERDIIEFYDSNVPRHPILPANRWGDHEDFGLLTWLNGSILQTALSALHMLRYSSSTFAFHVIPYPRPTATPLGCQDDNATCLLEGFGTVVLVNRNDEMDRAMIINVRPPAIVTANVLREFSRDDRAAGRDSWRHLANELAEGDIGQANLLQAQVYDDCVRNQVYFFAVTNLKQWVFGSFNSTYTKASVGPVIDRKCRNPSLMQCLTAWLVRSFDVRPRDDHRTANGRNLGRYGHRRRTSSRGSLRQRDHNAHDEAPPYSGSDTSRTPIRRPSIDDDASSAARRRNRHASAPPASTVGDQGFQPVASLHPAEPFYDTDYSVTPTQYQSMTMGYPQYPAWTGHQLYPAHATYSTSPVPAYSMQPTAYADPRWQQQMNHSRSWSSQVRY